MYAPCKLSHVVLGCGGLKSCRWRVSESGLSLNPSSASSPGTLGKVINLAEPLFSHLLNQNKIIIC